MCEIANPKPAPHTNPTTSYTNLTRPSRTNPPLFLPHRPSHTNPAAGARRVPPREGGAHLTGDG